MKGFLLSIVLTYMALSSAFGQNYNPLVKQNSNWMIKTWYWDIYTTHTFVNVEKYWLYDSIVYDSIQYQYLFWGNDSASSNLNYNQAHLLREDSARKVFIRFNNQDQPTTYTEEFKIYDFSMEIGDTSVLYKGTRFQDNNWRYSYVLKSYDTVIISGQMRKRYHLQDTSGLIDDYWIEGIGSPELGLLSNWATVELSVSGINLEKIGCFWDDQILFQRKSGRACEYLSIEENPYHKNSIIVFPNPTLGILNFDQIEKNLSYKVYNIHGEMITSGCFNENNFIDITDSPDGIYLIRLISENEDYTIKVLKK